MNWTHRIYCQKWEAKFTVKELNSTIKFEKGFFFLSINWEDLNVKPVKVSAKVWTVSSSRCASIKHAALDHYKSNKSLLISIQTLFYLKSYWTGDLPYFYYRLFHIWLFCGTCQWYCHNVTWTLNSRTRFYNSQLFIMFFSMKLVL